MRFSGEGKGVGRTGHEVRQIQLRGARHRTAARIRFKATHAQAPHRSPRWVPGTQRLQIAAGTDGWKRTWTTQTCRQGRRRHRHHPSRLETNQPNTHQNAATVRVKKRPATYGAGETQRFAMDPRRAHSTQHDTARHGTAPSSSDLGSRPSTPPVSPSLMPACKSAPAAQLETSACGIHT